jgi:UDP-glucose 4-epimerase
MEYSITRNMRKNGVLRMAILVTGGAGYIGSHTSVELLETGYELILLDNFTNSKVDSIRSIKEITGKEFICYEVDLLNREKIEEIFQNHLIEAVVHFAGLKAVGESVSQPLRYYHNNVTGTINLCEIMEKYGVKKMVFSSSATVYGMPKSLPISETATLNATNPYGQTKLMIENILRDLHVADPNWSVALLRYFNPVGAHESGKIGESPNGIPSNLFPYLSQVAVGKLKELKVFGNNFPTLDGTGVRDYVHVSDLAQGHLKALEKVMTTKGVEAYNLGSGTGFSVLEMVTAFEKASEKKIPYQIVDRRQGDIAVCYADTTKAREELGWVATKGIEDMCHDEWRWQKKSEPY